MYLHKQGFSSFQPKAVLFDMDGVLFDSLPGHVKAWVETLAAAGTPMTAYEVYLQEGQTGKETINQAFMKYKGRLATEEEIQSIYAEKVRRFDAYGAAVVMPFAAEVLAEVRSKGWKVGMVTGSGQESLLTTLNLFFPGYFCLENMVTSYDVSRGKPYPEPYLKGLEKLGVLPYETLVVENAPFGVRAATAAGIFTMAVNTGILRREDLSEAGADKLFDSMEDLYHFLQQWPA